MTQDNNLERVALVVDDDRAARELIARRLAAMGFRVHECADGEAATEKLASLKIDLVCLDLALPTRSGFEVCEHIRANPATAELPVLIISARTSMEDHARALEAGASAILNKPFRPHELQELTTSLMNNGHSADD